MDPAEAIEAGRRILDLVMVPAGFVFELGTEGKGSGGHCASASYRKGNRTLSFSYRWALGEVEYRLGEARLDHDSYMRSLSVYRESEYCRFPRDVPLAGFEALRYDLERYCQDFLTGPGEEFTGLAKALKANPGFGRGLGALDTIACSANPYASPLAATLSTRQARPTGTLILAVILMLFGLALGFSEIVLFARLGPSLPLTAYLNMGLIGVAAIAASVGLLSGERWGWWLAVAFCFVGFASFTLLPIVRRGRSELTVWTFVKGAIFFVIWLYRQRRKTCACYGQNGAWPWRVQVGLFLLVVAAILGLGIW